MATIANNQSATAGSAHAAASASPGCSSTAKTSPGVIKVSAPKTHKRKKESVVKSGIYKTLGFLQSLPNKVLVFVVTLWTRLTSGSEKGDLGSNSKASAENDGKGKGATKVARTSGKKGSSRSAVDDQSGDVVGGVDGANNKRKKKTQANKSGKANEEAAGSANIEGTEKPGNVQRDTQTQPGPSTTLSKNKSGSNLPVEEPLGAVEQDAWEVYKSKGTKKRTKKETGDTSTPKPAVLPNYKRYAGEEMEYLPSSDSDESSEDGDDGRSESPGDSEDGSEGESGDTGEDDTQSGDSSGSEDSDDSNHPEQGTRQEYEDIDEYGEEGEDAIDWSEGSSHSEEAADPEVGGIAENNENEYEDEDIDEYGDYADDENNGDRFENSRHSEGAYQPTLGAIEEVDEEDEGSDDSSDESNHSEEDMNQEDKGMDIDGDGEYHDETSNHSQDPSDFEDGTRDGTEGATGEEGGEAQEDGEMKDVENGPKPLNNPEEPEVTEEDKSETIQEVEQTEAIPPTEEDKSETIQEVEEIEDIPPTLQRPATDDEQGSDTTVTAEASSTEAKLNWADYEEQFPSLEELNNFAKQCRAKK